MARVLFFKSHVKGHFRGGKWVKDYDNTVQKKPGFFAKFKGEKGPPPSFDDAGWDGHIIPGEKPKPKPMPKPEGFHPKAGDKGEQVAIYSLSHPTPLAEFADPSKIATVVPGGPVPESLNGVPFAPWDDVPRSLHDWAEVDGQNVEDEPDMPDVPPHVKLGAGVIVQEPDGRFWVIHPTNQFGGYKGSFPKGTVEDGLPMQASAIKEAYEESGLKVELLGHFMDVKRTTSMARYYRARRVGGTPSDMGWESQSCSLVPADKLYEALNMAPDHKLAEALGAGPAPKPKLPPKPSKPQGGGGGYQPGFKF